MQRATFVHPALNTASSFPPFLARAFQVEVKFVDIKTTSYVENKKLCEFWIRGTGRGILENPQHSVPPNTTCLYHFQVTSRRCWPFEDVAHKFIKFSTNKFK